MAAYASRYARAFAQVAASSKLDLAAARQHLSDFAATLTGSRELREVLTDPSIALEQKLKVLDAIAQRLGMAQPVRNFVAVIIDHQRLSELNDILVEYDAVADLNAGTTEVEVISARGLDDAEREALIAKAGELAGGHIHASFREDASLLGGAVLKIGSTIYDGSLKAQLAGMKQRLVEAHAG